MATVYLIHFEKPYGHARHYIGVTRGDLASRIKRHRASSGANLTRVVVQAGIRIWLARAWHDAPRSWERTLKRMGGAPQLCPHCNPYGALNRGRLPEAGVVRSFAGE